MDFESNGTYIKLKKGDITEEECDAIVNAANSSLMGGGGVDGAIHRKAGKKLDKECLKIRKEKYIDGLPTGEAVITTGGNLKAKFVIHTVGPIWKGGEYKEKELLKNCFFNSLKLALDNSLKSIAFPAISTGAYGFPMDKASEASIQAIYEFLNKNPNRFKEICIVLFTDDAYENFEKALKKIIK
ncbi:MAG: O-acetyl-ADP-ribose deacetylase [Thermoplasmata archaeon]